MKKLSKKPNPIKGIELAMANLIGGFLKFRVQAPDFKGKKTLFHSLNTNLPEDLDEN
jgi:hypothetical protein